MGQQQLMLLVLGVIIVGIAIVVGINLFTATSVSSNKDAIVNDIMNLGQYAYRYRLRPEPLGGGGRSYLGLNIPADHVDNENATYTYLVSPNSVTFTATSKFGYGTIVVTLDDEGKLGIYTFNDDFL
ncbi:MAG: hypothetical protein QME58_11300 [Bacteroidota bacterium]|nr:hypothetical protein [Bacteroidota bacterium]